MKGNVNFPVNYSTLFLEIYEQVFHVKCYMSWFPSRFVHIFSRTISIHFIWVEYNLISWACWFHAVYWRSHTYVLRVHGSRRLCENQIYNFELSTFYFLVLSSLRLISWCCCQPAGRGNIPSAYMKHCCTLQASSSTWDERSHRYRQLKW